MIKQAIYKMALLAGLAALAVMVSVGAARADTMSVFSNFGAGGSYNASSSSGVGTPGFTPGNFVQAMPFTAGVTADLADAVLALANVSGTNSAVTLDLESNSSGQPGTILATLTQQGTIPGLVTFDYSGTSVDLTSGTTYWLVALETDTNSFQGWDWSNSDFGPDAYFNSVGSATGPWTAELTSSAGTISAFQVDGTVAQTATTPEPASLLLFGTGLLGLGLLVRRKFARGITPHSA